MVIHVVHDGVSGPVRGVGLFIDTRHKGLESGFEHGQHQDQQQHTASDSAKSSRIGSQAVLSRPHALDEGMHAVSRQQGDRELHDHQDHHRCAELGEEGDEVEHDVGYGRQVPSEGDQKRQRGRQNEKHGHARRAQQYARYRQDYHYDAQVVREIGKRHLSPVELPTEAREGRDDEGQYFDWRKRPARGKRNINVASANGEITGGVLRIFLQGQDQHGCDGDGQDNPACK